MKPTLRLNLQTSWARRSHMEDFARDLPLTKHSPSQQEKLGVARIPSVIRAKFAAYIRVHSPAWLPGASPPLKYKVRTTSRWPFARVHLRTTACSLIPAHTFAYLQFPSKYTNQSNRTHLSALDFLKRYLLFRGSAAETLLCPTRTSKHALSTTPILRCSLPKINTHCPVPAPQKQQGPSTYAVVHFLLRKSPFTQRSYALLFMCALSPNKLATLHTQTTGKPLRSSQCHRK